MSGYTKRQFIEAALEELGLASYAFDMQPQQMISAGRRLDAMAGEWNGKGIRLGYPISNPTTIDLNEQTNVPDSANEAIITNLAIRLAPSFGRQVMPGTMATAKQAYNTVLSRSALPPEQQLPSMPAGAGQKPWRIGNPFTPEPEDDIAVGPDGVLIYNP